MQQTDILVIGGGIAGTSTACCQQESLASHGINGPYRSV